jgi:hypothetical protein
MRTELEQELSDLRREVIEGRNLVIRTDNLLKTLHTEMKAFERRQKAFDRRQMLSSAAAYALFALLAGGAALLLSGARTAVADSERDKAVAELKALTRSIDKDRTERAAVAAARRSAGEAYRMMTDLPGERRLEGITALAKMDQSKLDPFERQALADRAVALRHELGQAAFERGKEAFRNKEWAVATDELSRSLTMEPQAPAARGLVPAGRRARPSARVRAGHRGPEDILDRTREQEPRGGDALARPGLRADRTASRPRPSPASFAGQADPARSGGGVRAPHHPPDGPRGAGRHADPSCCARPGHGRARLAPARGNQDRRRVLRRSLSPRERRHAGDPALTPRPGPRRQSAGQPEEADGMI